MSNWEKVYSTKDILRANIVQSTLEDHGLSVILMDKRDSSYNDFGEREIYVLRDEVIRALKLIEDEIKFE